MTPLIWILLGVSLLLLLVDQFVLQPRPERRARAPTSLLVNGAVLPLPDDRRN